MLTVPDHPQTFKEIMIVGFTLWKQGLKKVLVPAGLTSFFGILLGYVLGLFLVQSAIGYFSIFLKSIASNFAMDSFVPSLVGDLGFLGFSAGLLAFIASFLSLGTIVGLIIFSIPLAIMIYGMHKTFTDPSAIKKPRFFDSSTLHLSDLIGYPISYKKLFLFTAVCFLSYLIIIAGFICFIVPGVIALFALFFAPYLFITGEYSMWGSMKASANLFSKDRWLVVKRLSVFILVSLLCSSFLLTTISAPDFDGIIKWAFILLFSSLFHACALSLLHDIQLRKLL